MNPLHLLLRLREWKRKNPVPFDLKALIAPAKTGHGDDHGSPTSVVGLVKVIVKSGEECHCAHHPRTNLLQ